MAVRVGSWVLSDVDGHLVATKPGVAPIVLDEVLEPLQRVDVQRIVNAMILTDDGGDEES